MTSTIEQQRLSVEAILRPHHIKQLQESGLSNETILACKFRSENRINEIHRILQNKIPKKCGIALVFPYFDVDGGINGFQRVKPDSPRLNPATNKTIKYETPRGATNRAYFPPLPFFTEAISDSTSRLIITEGEKKAAKACQEGFATIGLVGVFGWKHGKGNSDSLIPDLSTISWSGREAVICFDSDVETNENIQDAEQRLAAQLKVLGAKVRVARLPVREDGEKVGIDDFLLSHTANDFHKILNGAGEPTPVMALALDNASSLDPMETAEGFLLKHATMGRSQLLWFWRDEFYGFDKYVYRKLPIPELRAKLIKYISCIARNVKTKTTNDTMDALKAKCILSYRREPPTWLTKPAPAPARECLATKNKIIHLPTLQKKGDDAMHVADPRLFTTNAVDFEYAPEAECPQWHDFLTSVWGDDLECITVLQEIIGYLLLPDTSQQKLFLLVGPKRSGKGTIARIIGELVGKENIAGPTLGSLQGEFGLQPLLGKTVAIIGDARLSGRSDISAIAERLLSITGEDIQTVNRKHMPMVTTRLTTRFLILTNEIPQLTDASATLPSRFVIVPFTKSFFGREDHKLFDRLKAELPGILNWAIEGWQRLHDRGFFIAPASSDEAIAEMEELSSPITAFLRDRCEIEPHAQSSVDDVWRAWRAWCARVGRNEGNKQTLGRNLRAAAPSVTVNQVRGLGGRLRVYNGLRITQSEEYRDMEQTDYT